MQVCLATVHEHPRTCLDVHAPSVTRDPVRSYSVPGRAVLLPALRSGRRGPGEHVNWQQAWHAMCVITRE